MIGVLIVVKAALALWACCMLVALRNRLRESEQIRDALVTAVHECRAEIARLRLANAEREAVADAADRYAEITPESAETAATLRGLLERLK